MALDRGLGPVLGDRIGVDADEGELGLRGRDRAGPKEGQLGRALAGRIGRGHDDAEGGIGVHDLVLEGTRAAPAARRPGAGEALHEEVIATVFELEGEVPGIAREGADGRGAAAEAQPVGGWRLEGGQNRSRHGAVDAQGDASRLVLVAVYAA